MGDHLQHRHPHFISRHSALKRLFAFEDPVLRARPHVRPRLRHARQQSHGGPRLPPSCRKIRRLGVRRCVRQTQAHERTQIRVRRRHSQRRWSNQALSLWSSQDVKGPRRIREPPAVLPRARRSRVALLCLTTPVRPFVWHAGHRVPSVLLRPRTDDSLQFPAMKAAVGRVSQARAPAQRYDVGRVGGEGARGSTSSRTGVDDANHVEEVGLGGRSMTNMYTASTLRSLSSIYILSVSQT